MRNQGDISWDVRKGWDKNSRIEALPGEWPSMCGIYKKREEGIEYLAGASLITPGVVLTAAHWVQ